HAGGALSVVKIAIDPVWYLPGIAERFGTTETGLRRTLFEQTAGMFPELVTRPDLQVFLPPVGGMTVYLFGDIAKLVIRLQRWRVACTTSAMALTCLARISAPVAPIWCTASRSVHARHKRVGSASSSTIARKAGPWGKLPSSWSTTPASDKKAVMLPAPISSAPNASPACRTRVFSN